MINKLLFKTKRKSHRAASLCILFQPSSLWRTIDSFKLQNCFQLQTRVLLYHDCKLYALLKQLKQSERKNFNIRMNTSTNEFSGHRFKNDKIILSLVRFLIPYFIWFWFNNKKFAKSHLKMHTRKPATFLTLSCSGFEIEKIFLFLALSNDLQLKLCN